MKHRLPNHAHIHVLRKSIWGETPSQSRSHELTCWYVDRYTGQYAGNLMTHHTWWEMICVTQGQGELLCTDRNIPLTVGSVCLVAPGLEHVEKSSGVMTTIWVGLVGAMLQSEAFQCAQTILSHSLVATFEEMYQTSLHHRGLVGPKLDGLARVLLGSFLQQSNEPKRSELEDRLDWAAEYLRHNFARAVSIAELAETCNCSEGHFYRSFHQHFETSPRRFLEKLRMEQAAKLLHYSDARIEDIAHDVGFEDPLYFSRAFRKFHNQSPSKFRTSLHREERLEWSTPSSKTFEKP